MKGRKPRNRLLRLFLCMILVLAMAGSSLSALAAETGSTFTAPAQTVSELDGTGTSDSTAQSQSSASDSTAPGDTQSSSQTGQTTASSSQSGTQGDSQSQSSDSGTMDTEAAMDGMAGGAGSQVPDNTGVQVPDNGNDGSSGGAQGSQDQKDETTVGDTQPSDSSAPGETPGTDENTSQSTDPSHSDGENGLGDGEEEQENLEEEMAEAQTPSPLSVLLNDPDVDQVPDHHKYIKANENGSYTLTLNVTGLYKSETGKKPKMDVLLIVDQSDSMNDRWGNTTRLQALKNVVSGENGLTEAILGNENIDAQMAIVGYSGSTGDRWGDTPYNDASVLQSWTSSKSAVDRVVRNIGAGSDSTTGSGTNCEAGLREAAQVLQSSGVRADAQKIVIFLSDGDPTYYYYPDDQYFLGWKIHSKGDTGGNGSSYDQTAADYAYSQAASIQGLSAFYTVGISSAANESFLRALANKSSADQKDYYGSKDSDDLAEVFAKIVAEVTEFTCRDVTITDTLSQYVDLSPTEGEIRLVITKNDSGAQLTDQEMQAEINAGLNFSVSVDGKTISASLGSGYTLKQNYTYSISFDVKPSQAAYDEFASNQTNGTYSQNSNYPHKGSNGSDAPGNTTSSGQPGFYSNNSASLTYTYGDTGATSNTVNYVEQPVVQVSSMSIPITKLWENDDPTLRPESITVNLYQDGKTEVYKTLTITPDDNGNWTGIFQYAAEGHTYTVQEEALDNYTPTISGSAQNGFTITNTRNTTDITVTKNWVDNNNADHVRPNSITIQLMNGEAEVGDPVTIGVNENGQPLEGTTVSDDGNQWSYTWADLPVLGNNQQYTVKELTQIDGYTPSYSQDGLTITNTRDASLTVGKKVTGAMGDKTASFEITITLKNNDGSAFIGEQTYAYIGGTFEDVKDANDAPEGGNITFTNGVGTILLSHGQTITIQNLPAGVTYEVNESDPQGHTVSYDQQTGTLPNCNITAVVTNHKDSVPVTGFVDNPAGGTLMAAMALFIGVGVVGVCTFFSRRLSRKR